MSEHLARTGNWPKLSTLQRKCVAGTSRHAALGSDLDGGFGREQSPRDLDTIADLQQLSGLLAIRGYGEADIAAILHGNGLRLLRQAWTEPASQNHPLR